MIIGGGRGGYVAAIWAAQLGLRVVLVEKERSEGIYLDLGGIPTKALLRNAEVVDLLQKGEAFGFTMSGYQVDSQLPLTAAAKLPRA